MSCFSMSDWSHTSVERRFYSHLCTIRCHQAQLFSDLNFSFVLKRIINLSPFRLVFIIFKNKMMKANSLASCLLFLSVLSLSSADGEWKIFKFLYKIQIKLILFYFSLNLQSGNGLLKTKTSHVLSFRWISKSISLIQL